MRTTADIRADRDAAAAAATDDPCGTRARLADVLGRGLAALGCTPNMDMRDEDRAATGRYDADLGAVMGRWCVETRTMDRVREVGRLIVDVMLQAQSEATQALATGDFERARDLFAKASHLADETALLSAFVAQPDLPDAIVFEIAGGDPIAPLVETRLPIYELVETDEA